VRSKVDPVNFLPNVPDSQFALRSTEADDGEDVMRISTATFRHIPWPPQKDGYKYLKFYLLSEIHKVKAISCIEPKGKT